MAMHPADIKYLTGPDLLVHEIMYKYVQWKVQFWLDGAQILKWLRHKACSALDSQVVQF